MSIDINTIKKFSGKINDILISELNAGNKIVETYEGDWPYPNSTMILLEKPFITPIQHDLSDIEFRNINDPHYWKAEYFDKINNMLLCCKFDGPDFKPL